MLVQKHLEQFSAEHQAVLKAGLASTSYQHIDDTSMRVNGENHYVVTLCNPYYTSFFTNKRKNRETVSLLLSQLERPGQCIATSAAKPDLINQHLGDYIKILVSDFAGQFSQLTTHRGLCWIHEGRLYEKLTPYLKTHRRMVEKFLTDFWEFYQKLKLYQRHPTREFKSILNHEFDRLFSQRPIYQALADRIALTKQKKEQLLLVLDFPEVPLDNNEAERALREYVIKRKISNGTRTAEGTRAWEIFLSLVDTCRKNSVNFYQYILDRIKKSFQLPSLASVILETARGYQANKPIYLNNYLQEIHQFF